MEGWKEDMLGDPPALWSVYERVRLNQHRTNNFAEAAHRRLQCQLQMDHRTVWKLIDGLRHVQKGRDVYYGQLVAGPSAPNIKLTKYQNRDKALRTLNAAYDCDNMEEFLRGCATNFVTDK